jgi:hypothetical protein
MSPDGTTVGLSSEMFGLSAGTKNEQYSLGKWKYNRIWHKRNDWDFQDLGFTVWYLSLMAKDIQISVSLCDDLIPRPEESYRLWYVTVCDLET